MQKNHASFLNTIFGEGGEQRRKIFHTIKAKADSERTTSEKIADLMTGSFGSMTFFILNTFVFVLWILINTGIIKWIKIFDPYPFNFLTMAVSLEAIVLAVFVLISQNRNSKVDDLRSETQLQVNLISEKEITKLMKITALIAEKNGIDLSQDPELKKLTKPTVESEIEEKLKKEIY